MGWTVLGATIDGYDMWTTHSVKSNNFILCPNKETGNVTSDAFIVTGVKGLSPTVNLDRISPYTISMT